MPAFSHQESEGRSMISRHSLFAGLAAGLTCFALAGAAGAADSHHWTYEGATGPDHWAELSSEFKTCQIGQKQTPINLTGAARGNEAAPKFDYHAFPIKILNNGHTIQVNAAPGSSITIGETKYELAQFHFHHPSEHLLDGKAFEIELHLVHKSAAGGLAVVGVFLKQGKENAALKAVFDQMPAKEAPAAEVKGSVDPAQLLPAARGFYRYAGSLTTPPCSEGIVWTVFKEPIELSPAQAKQFSDLFENNARPVQSLHGRSLVEVD
jgi:carbonic anhydrase